MVPNGYAPLLAVMSHLFTGVLAEAYVELWVASRSIRELADALRETEVAARDAVRALFGPELLEHATPEFDVLLDVTLYAMRGMTIDVHLADEAERRARANLVVGMETYFHRALGLES